MSNTTRVVLASLLAVALGLMPVQPTLASAQSSSGGAAAPEPDSRGGGATQALLGAATGVAVTGFVLGTVARPTYEAYDPETGEYEEHDVDIDAKPFYLAAGGLMVIAALVHLAGGTDDPGEGHSTSGGRAGTPARGVDSVGVCPVLASDCVGVAVEIRF